MRRSLCRYPDFDKLHTTAKEDYSSMLKGCLGDSDLIALLNSGQEDSAGQLSILGGNI